MIFKKKLWCVQLKQKGKIKKSFDFFALNLTDGVDIKVMSHDNDVRH